MHCRFVWKSRVVVGEQSVKQREKVKNLDLSREISEEGIYQTTQLVNAFVITIAFFILSLCEEGMI